MGDEISLQYGGSIAHHANLSKKKGLFKNALPELWTSVKRHWANNFSDSSKQGAINLFLGMYIPSKNTIPLWNLESDTVLHQCDKDKLPRLPQNWWDNYLNRFESKLPVEVRNDKLNFFKDYETLKENQKPHFLPNTKISIKKIIEVDEMEKITKEEKHFYIFDGIDQTIRQEIDQLLHNRRKPVIEIAAKYKPKEVIDEFTKKSLTTSLVTANNFDIGLKSITIDDLAMLKIGSDTHREVDARMHAFDDSCMNRTSIKIGLFRNETFDRLSNFNRNQLLFRNDKSAISKQDLDFRYVKI